VLVCVVQKITCLYRVFNLNIIKQIGAYRYINIKYDFFLYVFNGIFIITLKTDIIFYT